MQSNLIFLSRVLRNNSMILAEFFLTRQRSSTKNFTPATKDCQFVNCGEQSHLMEKYEITILTDDTINMH